jgi:hypothetical protein
MNPASENWMSATLTAERYLEHKARWFQTATSNDGGEYKKFWEEQ